VALSAVRPLRRLSIAAFRFCGVTPPFRRMLPASPSFSSVNPSNNRSTVTKLSPALSAAFSAASNARANSGAR
jgi:hypothetical protein